MTRNRLVAGVVALAGVCALVTACGSGGGTGTGGGTGLQAALSRVADTSSNRGEISYDDTSALVRLAGKHLGTGFGPLVAMGATGLDVSLGPIQGQADIRLLDERYAISAGTPPRGLGVVAGGQDAARVTTDLTRLGWKRHGTLLVMLPLNLSNPLDAETGGWLSQARPSGSDLIYGMPQADLSQAGAPAGQTLAQDPRIGALARCLGDVVAAVIVSGYNTGAAVKPAVAVGVAAPASNSAVPQAVACAAWPSPGAASRYAANLRTALASGHPIASRQRWSAILHQASVTVVGGSENLVEWQAQTPQSVQTVFQMIYNLDLPGLPNCLVPAANPECR